MLSCLPGALSASFWPFLTLKAIHVRKNKWLFDMREPVIRVDILCRLVPQLTPLDFYFLRYGRLTGTRWCWYEGRHGGIIEKNFFN
jgi:hypothetical protein